MCRMYFPRAYDLLRLLVQQNPRVGCTEIEWVGTLLSSSIARARDSASMLFNRKTLHGVQQKISEDSGWWFQIFFIFTPIWGRFPF